MSNSPSFLILAAKEFGTPEIIGTVCSTRKGVSEDHSPSVPGEIPSSVQIGCIVPKRIVGAKLGGAIFILDCRRGNNSNANPRRILPMVNTRETEENAMFRYLQSMRGDIGEILNQEPDSETPGGKQN